MMEMETNAAPRRTLNNASLARRLVVPVWIFGALHVLTRILFEFNPAQRGAGLQGPGWLLFLIHTVAPGVAWFIAGVGLGLLADIADRDRS